MMLDILFLILSSIGIVILGTMAIIITILAIYIIYLFIKKILEEEQKE